MPNVGLSVFGSRKLTSSGAGAVRLHITGLRLCRQVFVNATASAIAPHSTRARPPHSPFSLVHQHRSSQHLTRVERMSCRSEPHGYWRFRNVGNEGVYIVTSPTHYPVKRRAGLYREGKLVDPLPPPARAGFGFGRGPARARRRQSKNGRVEMTKAPMPGVSSNTY